MGRTGVVRSPVWRGGLRILQSVFLKREAPQPSQGEDLKEGWRSGSERQCRSAPTSRPTSKFAPISSSQLASPTGNVRRMHHITMTPTLVFAQQVMSPSAPDRRMTPEWAQWPRRRAKCRPLPGEVHGFTLGTQCLSFPGIGFFWKLIPSPPCKQNGILTGYPTYPNSIAGNIYIIYHI